MANVAFVRDEVTLQLKKWTLIRDCLEGQEKVKSKGDTYLPRPNADDSSEDNIARYQTYLQRAVFYNVTRRTLDGLVGQVFMRDPVIEEFPDALKATLLSDVDGAGVGLFEQSKKTLADTMSFGRVGLLADYPKVEGVVTRAEIDQGFIRPTIVEYQPEQILNWRTRTIGGRKLLSLVVLQETFTLDDDGFQPTVGVQWRVLRLNAANEYTVEIWRENNAVQQTGMGVQNGTPEMSPTTVLPAAQSSGATSATIAESFTPKDYTGQPLKEIPFVIIGAINNDPIVDPAPLYDLAVLNIAHYRNSADYEEACFLVGQPTMYAAGLTESWVTNVLKGEVALGSRSLLPLPEGGSAGLLQVSPNSMPKEAMEQKERQMVALGARLVEQRNVQRTLGEAQQEESSEASILTSVAKNVGAAYTRALNWCLAFTGGANQKATYALNTDFIATTLSPEERAELVAEWQNGAIAYSEMRRAFRRAGVAVLSDEEAKSEASSDPNRQGPTSLMNTGNSRTGGANNGRPAPKANGKTT